MNFSIRQMIETDIDNITRTFSRWYKQREQYERYWEEHQEGQRLTLVAVSEDQVVGYATLVWQPEYAPFREAGIPEIKDMNVIDEFQKQGIGTALIGEAERIASAHGEEVIGIGFGLTPDYGAAQRLYPKLGYIPDGKGAQVTPWGDVLHLTKRLK
jgi:GNAT superfamily N-acetyltransferase